MKILRAKFQNFRLLRDLEIDFSMDPDRRLTVIRAENESGKTTILTGLQWGLYGDTALPANTSEFRLHPIDWDDDAATPIPISVEIDLEFTDTRRTRAGKPLVTTRKCRVIRATQETLRGSRGSALPPLYGCSI